MIVKRDSTDASESGSAPQKKIHPEMTVIVAMTQTIQEIIRSGDKGVERTNLDEVPMRKRMIMMIFQSNHLKFIWLALKTV